MKHQAFISFADVNLFGHDDDVYESSFDLPINDEEENVDITSEEYISEMYKKVFNIDSIPSRDMDIIKTYCNEKSFERAITVCYKLLEKFSHLPSGVSKTCNLDTKIIIDCHEVLIDNRIPHCYKAGMIILLVVHRYHNAKSV